MKRVLIVSPHFPPDTGAATHRMRLLAPHLPSHGWEPTIVAVDPRDYETRLEPELMKMVPPELRVVRARAFSPRWTRRLRIGDLGLRSIHGLHRVCSELLSREEFDALYITIFPTYPALLGPILKRRFRIPFALDYIDPWVGAWGLTVGGGRDGAPDFKSRMTRRVGMWLEPWVVRSADAITAVSAATYNQIKARVPEIAETPCREIPYGGEVADFDYLRDHPRPNRFFDSSDGCVHVCYLGTLLPLGFETLRGVLKGAALLKRRDPQLYARLRLHFFGTSNQTSPEAPQRVAPAARALGVDDCVMEIAPRIDYLDALTVQTQAGAILMMGSSEAHYTASKLYPGLLARRPILAVYHEQSTVVRILRDAARPPSARVVTYNDTERAESRAEAIYRELRALMENPAYDPAAVDLGKVEEFSAKSLAGLVAQALDAARERKRRPAAAASERPSRKVLIISPHYPPDNGAAAHRARLLAPHMAKRGWEPTILTVDPRYYEGTLDHELARLAPEDFRVVRCGALPAALTQWIGVRDIGLRSFLGLHRACADLLSRERFDAIYITTYPTYPALLGPIFRRGGVTAFALDYQDPWIGAWGLTVGGGPGGRPDLKSKLTRRIAKLMEPIAARGVDGVTTVSRATFDEIRARHPRLAGIPYAELPIGGEMGEFAKVREQAAEFNRFDPRDGDVHVCCVGTLLPLGLETLEAIFAATALLRDRRPELYARLRLHFYGTSNQPMPDAPRRVAPVAERFGVTERVEEIAPRIGYVEAMAAQINASAILIMGSSERHYTASKLYPALLAKRPLLAVFHEASSVVEILQAAAKAPTARLVTYNDEERAESKIEAIYEALAELIELPQYRPEDVDMSKVAKFSAEALAAKLADLLEAACRHAHVPTWTNGRSRE